MESRLSLQTKLETVLGSRNVYFQPPETVKLNYPAIIYNLSDIEAQYADNKAYAAHKRYTVTYIHKDPDVDLFTDMMTIFAWCSFDRRFVTDNLYHDVYSLYY